MSAESNKFRKPGGSLIIRGYDLADHRQRDTFIPPAVHVVRNIEGEYNMDPLSVAQEVTRATEDFDERRKKARRCIGILALSSDFKVHGYYGERVEACGYAYGFERGDAFEVTRVSVSDPHKNLAVEGALLDTLLNTLPRDFVVKYPDAGLLVPQPEVTTSGLAIAEISTVGEIRGMIPKMYPDLAVLGDMNISYSP